MRQHNNLHAAIRDREPLRAIQKAFEENPSNLTENVLLDACEHDNLEVLRFLANKFLCPEGYTWDAIVIEASKRFFRSGLGKGEPLAFPMEQLSIQFEEGQSQRIRLAMMELVGHLSNLKKLVLFDVVDPEGHFCDSLAQLIRQVPLQEVRIAFDHDYTPPDAAIRNLLDAIQNSSHMKELWLFMGKTSSQTKTLCLSSLVEILQYHNSPLQRVVLDFPGGYNKHQLQLKQQLRYQAALNRSGRGKVRGPNATVSDLVQVINSATGTKASPVSVDAVLFGLLKESPALWSTITTTTAHPQRSQETPSSRSARKRPSTVTGYEGFTHKAMRLP